MNTIEMIKNLAGRNKVINSSDALYLLAELEAAEKEISDWRSVAEAAAQDDADWHKLADRDTDLICEMVNVLIATGERAKKAEAELSAANEKLSNPVKLPKTNGYWNAEEQAFERGIQLARKEILKAGFTVEGE